MDHSHEQELWRIQNGQKHGKSHILQTKPSNSVTPTPIFYIFFNFCEIFMDFWPKISPVTLCLRFFKCFLSENPLFWGPDHILICCTWVLSGCGGGGREFCCVEIFNIHPLSRIIGKARNPPHFLLITKAESMAPKKRKPRAPNIPAHLLTPAEVRKRKDRAEKARVKRYMLKAVNKRIPRGQCKRKHTCGELKVACRLKKSISSIQRAHPAATRKRSRPPPILRPSLMYIL